MENPKNDSPKEPKKYPPETVKVLQYTYIFAIIFWILLVILLGLGSELKFSLIILFIPLLIFAISIWNLQDVTVDDEENLFAINYLSIGVFVIIPMITWGHDKLGAKGARLMKIATVAMIMAVFSLIDVWHPPAWTSIIKHIRAIFQVISLTLIIYALCILFTEIPDSGIEKPPTPAVISPIVV
jgi:hypothetical protein